MRPLGMMQTALLGSAVWLLLVVGVGSIYWGSIIQDPFVFHRMVLLAVVLAPLLGIWTVVALSNSLFKALKHQETLPPANQGVGDFTVDEALETVRACTQIVSSLPATLEQAVTEAEGRLLNTVQHQVDTVVSRVQTQHETQIEQKIAQIAKDVDEAAHHVESRILGAHAGLQAVFDDWQPKTQAVVQALEDARSAESVRLEADLVKIEQSVRAAVDRVQRTTEQAATELQTAMDQALQEAVTKALQRVQELPALAQSMGQAHATMAGRLETMLEQAQLLLTNTDAMVLRTVDVAQAATDRTETLLEGLTQTVTTLENLMTNIQGWSDDRGQAALALLEDLRARTEVIRAALSSDVSALTVGVEQAENTIRRSAEAAQDLARNASMASADMIKAIIPLEMKVGETVKAFRHHGQSLTDQAERIQNCVTGSIETVDQVLDRSLHRIEHHADQIMDLTGKMRNDTAEIEDHVDRVQQHADRMGTAAEHVQRHVAQAQENVDQMAVSVGLIEQQVEKAVNPLMGAVDHAEQALRILEQMSGSGEKIEQQVVALRQSGQSALPILQELAGGAEEAVEGLNRTAAATEQRLESLVDRINERSLAVTEGLAQTEERIERVGDHATAMVERVHQTALSASEGVNALMGRNLMTAETSREQLEALENASQAAAHRLEQAFNDHLQRLSDTASPLMSSISQEAQQRIRELVRLGANQMDLLGQQGGQQSHKPLDEDNVKTLLREVAVLRESVEARSTDELQAQVQELMLQVETVIPLLRQLPTQTVSQDPEPTESFLLQVSDMMSGLTRAGLDLAMLVEPNGPSEGRLRRVLDEEDGLHRLRQVLKNNQVLSETARKFCDQVDGVMYKAKRADPTGVLTLILEETDVVRMGALVRDGLST